MTPTLKLKRRVVAEHFSAEIEELYALEAAAADVGRRVPAGEAEILTTSPVCGAWMKLPPPT